MAAAPATSAGRDYDAANPASLLRFGRRAISCTARQICSIAGQPDPSQRLDWKPTKGVLGDVMEWYFGIPKNNSPEPDFPLARVELKILPLKKGTGGYRVKEPTSISMIDYGKVSTEEWKDASVRKKLDRILIVFIAINPADIMESKVLDVILWEPNTSSNEIFESDWTRTRDMVREGEAHMLSETQAEALAARRKGAGGPGRDLRTYPGGKEPAKSRAWALKTAFTRQIYEQEVLHVKFESVVPDVQTVRVRDLIGLIEQRIPSSLQPYIGWTVEAFAKEKGLTIGGGKNLAATMVKKSLGFRNVNAKVLEFEQMGVDVKTLNLRLRDGMPFEAVSFPVVDLQELASQEWEGAVNNRGVTEVEGSTLAEQLHRILFVPLFSAHRSEAQERRIIGRAFFWTPSEREWGTIEREWRMFRDEVRSGKAKYELVRGSRARRNRLTPASETEIIHMRPHGRNAKDEYLDPLGNPVTKQCFWLNKAFVAGLVRQNAWPPPICAQLPS